jgi:hypothetical protein
MLSAVRFCYECGAEARAKEWLAQAQTDARTTWTEDDAVNWLRNHGFNAYRGEAGSSGPGYVVNGGRQIEKGGIIVRPASVIVTFTFGLDHRYIRVEYEVWPFEKWP